MHQINLLNNIKIKENRNSNNEEYENRKSIYSRKTIIFILIAVIAGLSLIAAIILISITFVRLTSSSMNTTILSTITRTTDNPNITFSNNILLSATMPITITTIAKTLVTTTAIAMTNLSVTTK
ncbi:unnamed protein product [Rotaria sp. Silwood2]|nr:unnamed protein product [Rotaria sp. Silwood2]CAF2737568.1 unnamed protein product [Rotaria sp. Silwood2]CAF2905261.1 unnamed protein product [Rotaria sp. Silwood2]CAF4253663.1 unnamed protein product [Rotaria sp. Silwood2]CAF4283361.1 unnamed protein product [Rotaria sp. Silwood2]